VTGTLPRGRGGKHALRKHVATSTYLSLPVAKTEMSVGLMSLHVIKPAAERRLQLKRLLDTRHRWRAQHYDPAAILPEKDLTVYAYTGLGGPNTHYECY
jgi:hypothetical protein